ncbi:MAG: accessory factor UbiK family protein [Rhizobiaceae bacterium]
MSDNNQGPSRIFDEFAKLMTDAAGVAQGARREVEGALKGQAERFMGQMDIVHRDEFEAVKEMAARARMENAELRKEIEALKKLVGGGAKKKPTAKAAPSATSKTSAKKPAKKAPAKKLAAKK